jgi:hypothetical protein
VDNLGKFKILNQIADVMAWTVYRLLAKSWEEHSISGAGVNDGITLSAFLKVQPKSFQANCESAIVPLFAPAIH